MIVYKHKISTKKSLKLTKDITPPKQNTQDFRIFFTKKYPAKKILKLTKDLSPPK
jgi:hypothetical protein